MGDLSCGFQQGDNIGIILLIGRYCSLDNSIIICSELYPIPILFLYHPYIP